jgi:pseudouridine-5'-phosphate glycosidase
MNEPTYEPSIPLDISDEFIKMQQYQQNTDEYNLFVDEPIFEKIEITKKQIGKYIEYLVEKLELSYLDSILQVKEYFELTEKDVSKYLSPQIIEKLREESVSLRLIRNDSKVNSLI